MLNLTIWINIIATTSLAAAVAVLPESGIVAIAISYMSGLLTVLGSHYHVGVEPAPGGNETAIETTQ